MTHAMVITGVHIDEKTGRPVRFKVENSWGDDSGHKGFMVMSEKWFDECVFHVALCSLFADAIACSGSCTRSSCTSRLHPRTL